MVKNVALNCLLLAWWALPLPAAAQSEMTAEALLGKVAQRAKEERSKPPRREFIRTKTTWELDKKGNIKTREERTYRMLILEGELYPRLIRKDGQTLTPAEQAKEEEKEAAFRNKRGKDAKSDKGNTVLVKLSDETAKRFDFAITGREQVNGRNAYVVAVTPKPGLRAKTIEEQVMACMSGRLWIDESEYELAKLEVCLREPVHFGLVGVMGALNEFDFSIYRNRRPDGGWENSLVKASLQFRVLFDISRFRYEEKVLPPN